MLLNKLLKLLLQLLYPLYRKQLLKRRMLSRVGYIRQSIISQKFTCLRQILSLRIQKLLKLSLFLPQFFLSLRLSLIIRVHYINDKVYLKIEFEFLADVVCVFYLLWHYFFPGLEEFGAVACVEGLGELV